MDVRIAIALDQLLDQLRYYETVADEHRAEVEATEVGSQAWSVADHILRGYEQRVDGLQFAVNRFRWAYGVDSNDELAAMVKGIAP